MGFGEWFQAKDIHCLHKIRKMSVSNNQWRATKKNEDRKITVAEEGWNLAGVNEVVSRTRSGNRVNTNEQQ